MEDMSIFMYYYRSLYLIIIKIFNTTAGDEVFW